MPAAAASWARLIIHFSSYGGWVSIDERVWRKWDPWIHEGDLAQLVFGEHSIGLERAHRVVFEWFFTRGDRMRLTDKAGRAVATREISSQALSELYLPMPASD